MWGTIVQQGGGGWGGGGVRVGGDRLLNRPRRFYRFPLSPPWRTSDLSRREDEGETGEGDRGGGGDKEGGAVGERGGTS